ncbi:MAG: glycoside hydrolase family 3 N-terminal domain-containing protein [Caldilineaceae bacterium]
MSQDIADGVVGSVVLFGRNIESPAQVQAMTTTLHGVSPHPLLIGIDQEGGWVSRLSSAFGISSNYSAQYLGEQNDLALTTAQGASTAAELAKLGINLNLAPVVDVNIIPPTRSSGAMNAAIRRTQPLWPNTPKR